MAVAIAFPGFSDLGRSVTPIFLLMYHFLYRFSMFSEKNEENLFTRSSSSKFFFLALRLSVRRFQTPLEGLSFLKTLLTLRITYAKDLLLQNMTKILCLR